MEKTLHRTQTIPLRQNRKLHFEIMRLLAIFFVVFTHTGDQGFFLFARYPDTHPLFWGCLAFSIFGSFAVPVFFAVSGALMLNRPEEGIASLWKKRVFKYGVLLVVVCFLYYLQANGYALQEINIREFIIILYAYCSGSITWFLYSYLAYLILLPVLRTLAQNLKDEHFFYIFAVVLVYQGLVPVLEYLVFQDSQTINSFFTVGWIAEKAVIYPLLGYFLEHRLQRQKQNRALVALWAVNLLTIALSCAMTVYRGRLMGEYAENISERFFSSFSLINCAAVYLAVARLTEKKAFSERTKKVLTGMGQCTFGIYLFHMLIMPLPVSEALRELLLRTGMDPMLASILFCLYVMAVSGAVTFLLRKIPVVKNFL